MFLSFYFKFYFILFCLTILVMYLEDVGNQKQSICSLVFQSFVCSFVLPFVRPFLHLSSCSVLYFRVYSPATHWRFKVRLSGPHISLPATSTKLILIVSMAPPVTFPVHGNFTRKAGESRIGIKVSICNKSA